MHEVINFSSATIVKIHLCLLQVAISVLSPGICLIIQTDKGFDKRMFEKQMSVMRGQVSVCAS